MAETVVGEDQIRRAWGRVFSGHGSREDAGIVIADLQQASGFYLVTTFDRPDSERAFADGARSVYGHFLRRIETDSAAVAVEREARTYRVGQGKQK